MADVMNDGLLAALRRHSPASVRVFDAADNDREIAIPNRRKRWNQVLSAIDARPWVRCEFLDAKGKVLGYFEHDGPAGELEVLGDGKGENAREMALLRVMLEAQRVALSHREKEITALLSGCTDTLRMNNETMHNLQRLWVEQANVASEVAAMRAEAAAGGDLEQWLKILEASPDLLAKFGPLLGMLLGKRRLPAAPTKPNGTNGAKQ